MAGEIIRMGDPTTHGGKVIEGSPVDICHGKPIAYVGHKTYCPQCKGNFPIIDGAATTTFYGKGVALAGMKTACGAALIATQFTDIVETGGGSRLGAADAHRNQVPTAGSTEGSKPSSQSTLAVEVAELEQCFEAVDSTGAPIEIVYRINAGKTKLTEATLAGNGATKAFPVDLQVQLVFWKAPT
jgi:uncharacterized Zn-binding protein involved in type VI secretion